MSNMIRSCVILYDLIIDYKLKHKVDLAYIGHALYVQNQRCTLVPRELSQTGNRTRGVIIAEMKS
jgi:hypothetical protein